MEAKEIKVTKVLGDRVLIDTNIKQEETKLYLPDDLHRQTLKGVVVLVGTEVKQAIEVGNLVLVKNFVGAPRLNVDNREYRLYDTENVLAIL